MLSGLRDECKMALVAAFANLVGTKSAKLKDKPKSEDAGNEWMWFLTGHFGRIWPDEVAMELHHRADQEGDEAGSERCGDPRIHGEQAGTEGCRYHGARTLPQRTKCCGHEGSMSELH